MFLLWNIVEFCQILFLWQVDDHVFPLYLVNVMWDDFHMLNEPCIPWINPTWTWCLVLLVCSWILSASILLRIFESVFIRNIGLYFCSSIVLWLCYQDKWISVLFQAFGKFWQGLVLTFLKCSVKFTNKASGSQLCVLGDFWSLIHFA